ncbi:MAG: DUF4846 domain-containing protein [Candidatus Saganbacteria bacterium]|nr:DUF4846 domain-containing protein [Candidatus Saganbacteria bacterium]
MKYVLTILLVLFVSSNTAFSISYHWTNKYDRSDSIVKRIPTPLSFTRTTVQPESFADWLRHLPLKKGKPRVMLYNNQEKINQNAHFAIVDIDIGKRNLQQCADAIMRLRAEYLYSLKKFSSIHFNFTNGKTIRWTKFAKKDYSYNNLRKYLNIVFSYAGSYSLSKELRSLSNINEIKIGDIFIEGGFPGHAVIIVDMAINKITGEKIFLLAQSYMPAQDIHILKNPINSKLSPWYSVEFGEILYTPEWDFGKNSLKRF